MELDLSSLASVRAFAAAWDKRAQPTLHVLVRTLAPACGEAASRRGPAAAAGAAQVNNAGVFDMGTPTRSATRDGHEQHFGTNYLARARLPCFPGRSRRRARAGGRRRAQAPALLTLLLLPHLCNSGQGA